MSCVSELVWVSKNLWVCLESASKTDAGLVPWVPPSLALAPSFSALPLQLTVPLHLSGTISPLQIWLFVCCGRSGSCFCAGWVLEVQMQLETEPLRSSCKAARGITRQTGNVILGDFGEPGPTSAHHEAEQQKSKSVPGYLTSFLCSAVGTRG